MASPHSPDPARDGTSRAPITHEEFLASLPKPTTGPTPQRPARWGQREDGDTPSPRRRKNGLRRFSDPEYIAPGSREGRAPAFTLPPDQYANAVKNIQILEDDAELIRQFLDGDESKFNDLVAKYYRRIWFLARRYTDSYDDAVDVMQDCLLKAYRNLHRYEQQASFGTWLHRLVTNQAHDSYAKRKNEVGHLPLEESGLNQEVQKVLSHNPIDGLDISLTLREALSTLHEDQQNAIILVDFLGYDIPVAAEKLNVRPGTVKSRRARGREELRKCLTNANNEIDL